MKRALVLLCALLLLCSCARSSVPTEAAVSAPPTIPQSRQLPENRTVRVCVTQMLADSPLAEQLRARVEAVDAGVAGQVLSHAYAKCHQRASR